MDLPNDEGTPVDPVPFFVVGSLAVATCYSFGPAYFLALGASLPVAVAASTVACLAAVAAAFYRLVWTARPEQRVEVPADVRLTRLVLAGIVGTVALVLFALPLLAR